MTIVAATGHRPPKAGLSWSHQGDRDWYYVNKVRDALHDTGSELDSVIVGGAQGWDTLVARACYLVGVPYHVFVPCDGQDSRWPDSAKARYRAMLKNARSVLNVNPGPYAGWKMMKRNEAMVNHALEVWALWDGSDGGTKHCIDYAREVGLPVVNFYEE